MPYRKSHNIGASGIRRKRRAADPMRTFDALPAQLRHWLSEAALPWSPQSAHRIWAKARAQGLGTDGALLALGQAEAKTLMRERVSPSHQDKSQL